VAVSFIGEGNRIWIDVYGINWSFFHFLMVKMWYSF